MTGGHVFAQSDTSPSRVVSACVNASGQKSNFFISVCLSVYVVCACVCATVNNVYKRLYLFKLIQKCTAQSFFAKF